MTEVFADRDGTTRIALDRVTREDLRIIDELGRHPECFVATRPDTFGGRYTVQVANPVEATSRFALTAFSGVADAIYLAARGPSKSPDELARIERKRFDEAFRLSSLYSEGPHRMLELPCRMASKDFPYDGNNFIDLADAFNRARNAMAVLQQGTVGLLPEPKTAREAMYLTARRFEK